jgi:hypothetical protein
MKIENLKELQKLIDLCHKNNIMAIEVDGIKLDLGAKPLKTRRQRTKPGTVLAVDPITGTQHEVTLKEVADSIATDGLTPEQLLNWSAGSGLPEGF